MSDNVIEMYMVWSDSFWIDHMVTLLQLAQTATE